MSNVNQSPCKTSQEVSDLSKASANQKLQTQKITDLENTIRHLEQTNKKLTDQINDQNNEMNKEKQKFKNQQNASAQIQNQKDQQIQKLIDENQKLVKTIKKIETDVNKLDQLKEENMNLKQVIQGQSQEIEELKQKIPKNETKLSSDTALGVLASKRSQEILVLKNENQEIKQKNQDLQAKLNNILKDNQQLQQIIQFDNPSQRLNSQASSSKQYNSSDKKQDQTNYILSEQVNKLQSELKEAKNTIEKLKKQNTISITPNNKPTTTINSINKSNSNDKIQKTQSFNNADFDKDKRFRDLEDQVKKLEFEKQNIAQEIRLEFAQDIKQLQDKLREEYEAKAQLDKEQDKPTQEQVKKLTQDNQKLQIIVQRQNKEIQNMEKKLTDLLITQEDIQQNLQKEKQFQDYLKQEKIKLQEQLKEKSKEISEHKEDIVKLAKERQQLKDLLEKSKSESKINQSQASNRPISQKSEISKKQK
ncbi:unnamed protein product [Paramecium octaurelia]|uniref:Uncharacterized protein n=1 Tax=Paramecium octaurelia TaxID=43137 RepID=A0A8S1SZX2_PAROT|nr:unnamed protein product [Paramecium octaurelia]